MFFVFLQGLAIDQDVVEIGCTRDVEERAEYIVNVVLKRAGSIGQSKRHDQIFEESKSCLEGGEVFVAFRDA